MIVVDATVISYFVIEGDFTEDVTALRRKDPAWAAPLLWRSELLNVLWKYLRRGDFHLDLAFQHYDLALDLIGPRTYDLSARQVLPLALSSGCSAYDCQYVALAHHLGVKLATHDKALLKAFPDTAWSPANFLGQ